MPTMFEEWVEKMRKYFQGYSNENLLAMQKDVQDAVNRKQYRKGYTKEELEAMKMLLDEEVSLRNILEKVC